MYKVTQFVLKCLRCLDLQLCALPQQSMHFNAFLQPYRSDVILAMCFLPLQGGRSFVCTGFARKAFYGACLFGFGFSAANLAWHGLLNCNQEAFLQTAATNLTHQLFRLSNSNAYGLVSEV